MNKSCLLLLLLTLSPALAEAASPTYLYHWTHRRGLEKLGENLKKNSGRLALEAREEPDPGAGEEELVVSVYFPFMKRRAILFTWTNPIGGMGRSRREIYAGRDGKISDARLVIVKLKPGARVAKISTKGISNPVWNPGPDIAPENVDLYEFEMWRDDKDKTLEYSEWIINNPGIIDSISADRDEVRAAIRAERRKFVKHSPSFDETDVYGGGSNDLYFKNGKPSAKALDWVNSILDNLEDSANLEIPPELRKR